MAALLGLEGFLERTQVSLTCVPRLAVAEAFGEVELCEFSERIRGRAPEWPRPRRDCERELARGLVRGPHMASAREKSQAASVVFGDGVGCRSVETKAQAT